MSALERFSFNYDFFLVIHRNGSVIVNLTLDFLSFDSFQFLLLQDSIEVDKSLGKIPLNQHQPYIIGIGPEGE